MKRASDQIYKTKGDKKTDVPLYVICSSFSCSFFRKCSDPHPPAVGDLLILEILNSATKRFARDAILYKTIANNDLSF